MSIQRYSLGYRSQAEKDDEGEYVLFAEHMKAITELLTALWRKRERIEALEWKPITETNIPQVGDEVTMFWPDWNGWVVREVHDGDGDKIALDGWTHFRSVNGPGNKIIVDTALING